MKRRRTQRRFREALKPCLNAMRLGECSKGETLGSLRLFYFTTLERNCQSLQHVPCVLGSARTELESRDMGERSLEEATAADMERRRRRPSTEDATLVRAAPAHQLLHRAATTFGNTQGVAAWSD